VINNRFSTGALQELKICRNAPGVSHLLFTDDTLLFFRAVPEQAEAIKAMLQMYGRCTGQQINPTKCSIMFSEKGQAESQEQVCTILQIDKPVFDAKYLGLLTPLGRVKGTRFQHLKERLSKRLKDYTERNMSVAAKDVLIKAVAQALPTYSMSVFKLPLGLCDDLTSIIRDFWWGTENGK